MLVCGSIHGSVYSCGRFAVQLYPLCLPDGSPNYQSFFTTDRMVHMHVSFDMCICICTVCLWTCRHMSMYMSTCRYKT